MLALSHSLPFQVATLSLTVRRAWRPDEREYLVHSPLSAEKEDVTVLGRYECNNVFSIVFVTAVTYAGTQKSTVMYIDT